MTDPFFRSLERNSTAYYAIVLLGGLKETKAIPWLIENIDLHATDYFQAYNSQEYRSLLFYFPCMSSLVNMGSLSFAEVLEAFRNSSDPVHARLLGEAVDIMLFRKVVESNAVKESDRKRLVLLKGNRDRDFPLVRKRLGDLPVSIEAPPDRALQQ